MSLVLNVEILGEFKKLTQATQGAQNSLSDMNKRAQTVSKSITRAFGAIGVGLSFRFIANELEEAAKAAVEDSKAQVLLADTLRKTVGATDSQIKSTEKYISALELSTQILDDKLRPAMAIALRSTGDMKKAQDLLNLAVDVSVGTGKDLEIVTKSIARAYDGNYTGLQKLVPGIEKGSGALDELRQKFDGAALAAAKTDPFKQMQVVFNDLQEQIGMALLPSLEKFATYIASPEGQEKLTKFIELVTGLAGKFEILATFATDNADAIVAWSGVLLGLGVTIKVLTTTLGIYNGVATIFAARNAAAAASAAAVGVAAAGAVPGITAMNVSAGALLGTLGLLTAGAIGAAFGGFMEGQQTGIRANIYSGGQRGDAAFDGFRKAFGVAPVGKVPTPSMPAPGARGNVNITINTPKVNAQDIVNTLNTANRNGYTGTLRSLKE
jgi:uncharacterized protein with GYD domain